MHVNMVINNHNRTNHWLECVLFVVFVFYICRTMAMYNDSQKKMEKALQLIKEEGLSFRDAAGQCVIPKSTI